MKICNLAQHGEDWHRWRAEGLGGSDAPTIMNENAFQCADELADVKMGRRIVRENAAMRLGKDREPIARAKYQQMTGILMRPVCVIHDQFPWLRASLDGLSFDNKIVLEIKCPSTPGTHYCALRGIPPKYYRAQLQHQLAVTGCEELHFFTYYPSEEFPPEQQVALCKVYPDRAYIERLLNRERCFWEQLQREKESSGQGNHQNRRRRTRRGQGEGVVPSGVPRPGSSGPDANASTECGSDAAQQAED